MGLFGAVSAGIRGILGVEVGRGCLQRFDEDRQAFLRLIGAHPLPRPVFLIFTTVGRRPRDSLGHDKGDRRSWGVRFQI